MRHQAPPFVFPFNGCRTIASGQLRKWKTGSSSSFRACICTLRCTLPVKLCHMESSKLCESTRYQAPPLLSLLPYSAVVILTELELVRKRCQRLEHSHTCYRYTRTAIPAVILHRSTNFNVATRAFVCAFEWHEAPAWDARSHTSR